MPDAGVSRRSRPSSRASCATGRAVFFALVFPLMFLVLFGGIFADQRQSKIDLVQIGDVTA